MSDHQAIVDANKKLNEEKIDLVSRINNLQSSLDKIAKMQKEKEEAEQSRDKLTEENKVLVAEKDKITE